MKINENFLKIESSYLFSTVAKKQREYQAAHPDPSFNRRCYKASCSCCYRCNAQGS